MPAYLCRDAQKGILKFLFFKSREPGKGDLANYIFFTTYKVLLVNVYNCTSHQSGVCNIKFFRTDRINFSSSSILKIFGLRKINSTL